MSIEAIIAALEQTSIPLQAPTGVASTDVAPDIAQRFANLLNSPEAPEAPGSYLSVQDKMNEVTVGNEMVAKIAGSLVQSINKLVNMS